MKNLRNKTTGVHITVADEKAQTLVASGRYIPVEPTKRPTRRPKNTPPAQTE